MRSRSKYKPDEILDGVFRMHVCSECGKEFIHQDEWVYKTVINSRRYWHCSYSCMNKFRRRLEEQHTNKKPMRDKRLPREDNGKVRTYVYTADGDLYGEYPSITKAAQVIGTSESYASSCMKRDRECKGYYLKSKPIKGKRKK